MRDEKEIVGEEDLDRLEMIGVALHKSRQQAIDARAASGIERQWIEDMATYQGTDGGYVNLVGQAAQLGSIDAPAKMPARATTHVHLTRQKTNAAAARLADMLYPTDDKNWSIRPTPVPQLSSMLDGPMADEPWTEGGQELQHPDEPRPMTLRDVAIDQMAQAQEKSDAMAREIDDALVECQYNYAGRRAILDAAILGTGILKGPLVVNRIKKKWTKQLSADGKSVHAMEVVQQTRPASVRVDPWNFFPDPGCGEDVQSGSHCWEREYVSIRKMRDLAATEGYLADQVRECIREGARHYVAGGDTREITQGRGEYGSGASTETRRFELWTYTGELSREELVACGVLEDDDEVDPLERMSAIVVMCNERVIMATLNPLEGGDLPYDVFVWERITLSPFGLGIPYLMRYAQGTINAAWRQMQDNAAMSHGPQIVVRRGQVQPADGVWEITGRKLWYATNDVDEVRKAFDVYEIPNRQENLQAIIEMAMRFADDETALPQIAQGEQGAAPDTVGGMTILMNSANTVLRRLVKQWDDMVTRPHIRRYYDWFMSYSDKDEIKGDYEIDARGSTALVVRDQQQQAVMQLMGLVGHPVFGIYLDPEKLLRKGFEASHIPPTDVMRTREQIAQEMNKPREEPMVPHIEAAKIRAQADIEKVRIDTESEKVNQELRMQEARDNRAAKLHEMALERDLMILKMSHERGLAIEDIKAKLAQTVIETRARSIDQEAKNRQARADQMARGPRSGDPRNMNTGNTVTP